MMQNKRIGIIADSFGSSKNTIIETSSQLMKLAGYNIGNWAFWNATKKIIDDETVLISGRPTAKDYISKIDILVIPAANWLQSRYDFSWLADFIIELDKPCIMIGLGAQSDTEEAIHPLSKGTLKMLYAVSARTPYIGVRGEYTYKVCQYYGVQNIKIMGCPSILTNNSPTLGKSIAKKWGQHTDGKTAIHATMFHTNVKQVEQWLFNYLKHHDGTSYIIQGPQSLLKPQFREPLNEKDDAFINKYRHTFEEGIPIHDLLGIIYLKGYLPYSVNAWINYLSFFSRAIGTRIHGSVLSLSAAIPTICITHDSRTIELCKVLQVPSITCQSISENNTIDELFDQIQFNNKAFDENRNILARSYKSLLMEVDITPSNHLLKIA